MRKTRRAVVLLLLAFFLFSAPARGEGTLPCEHGHTAFRVLREPACDSPGEEAEYCQDCGAEIPGTSREIAPLEHVYQYVPSREPTCTQDGYEEYAQCALCHEIPDGILVLPATGHTRGESAQTGLTQSSCTQDGGYDTVVCCTVCGTELERVHTVIPASGHSFGPSHVIQKPDCTESGLEGRTCQKCGFTETWSLDAKGHDFGPSYVITASTCKENGLEGQECRDCHFVETWPLPLGAHVPGEGVNIKQVYPTCEKAGSYQFVHYCKICNTMLDKKDCNWKPTGHKWGEWMVLKVPSSDENGLASRICENDKTHVDDMIIPAGTRLGFNFGSVATSNHCPVIFQNGFSLEGNQILLGAGSEGVIQIFPQPGQEVDQVFWLIHGEKVELTALGDGRYKLPPLSSFPWNPEQYYLESDLEVVFREEQEADPFSSFPWNPEENLLKSDLDVIFREGQEAVFSGNGTDVRNEGKLSEQEAEAIRCRLKEMFTEELSRLFFQYGSWLEDKGPGIADVYVCNISSTWGEAYEYFRDAISWHKKTGDTELTAMENIASLMDILKNPDTLYEIAYGTAEGTLVFRAGDVVQFVCDISVLREKLKELLPEGQSTDGKPDDSPGENEKGTQGETGGSGGGDGSGGSGRSGSDGGGGRSGGGGDGGGGSGASFVAEGGPYSSVSGESTGEAVGAKTEQGIQNVVQSMMDAIEASREATRRGIMPDMNPAPGSEGKSSGMTPGKITLLPGQAGNEKSQVTGSERSSEGTITLTDDLKTSRISAGGGTSDPPILSPEGAWKAIQEVFSRIMIRGTGTDQKMEDAQAATDSMNAASVMPEQDMNPAPGSEGKSSGMTPGKMTPPPGQAGNEKSQVTGSERSSEGTITSTGDLREGDISAGSAISAPPVIALGGVRNPIQEVFSRIKSQKTGTDQMMKDAQSATDSMNAASFGGTRLVEGSDGLLPPPGGGDDGHGSSSRDGWEGNSTSDGQNFSDDSSAAGQEVRPVNPPSASPGTGELVRAGGKAAEAAAGQNTQNPEPDPGAGKETSQPYSRRLSHWDITSNKRTVLTNLLERMKQREEKKGEVTESERTDMVGIPGQSPGPLTLGDF